MRSLTTAEPDVGELLLATLRLAREPAHTAADTGAPLLSVGPELVDSARHIASEQPRLKIIAMEPVAEPWPEWCRADSANSENRMGSFSM